MKKRVRKLSLKKDSLRNLTPAELAPAAGGAAAAPSDWSHMDDPCCSETCSYPIHEQEPIIVEVD